MSSSSPTTRPSPAAGDRGRHRGRQQYGCGLRHGLVLRQGRLRPGREHAQPHQRRRQRRLRRQAHRQRRPRLRARQAVRRHQHRCSRSTSRSTRPVRNLVIAGNFAGTSNFDPGGTNTTLTSINPAQFDGFVLKLSSNLGFGFAARAGVANGSGSDAAADSQGNVYLVGTQTPGAGNAFVNKYNGIGMLATREALRRPRLRRHVRPGLLGRRR